MASSKPSIKSRWTPFEFVPTQGRHMGPNEELYCNATHQVALFPANAGEGLANVMDGWVVMSIKRKDRQAECDWRIFQRIKNELLGPEREAVQLFPAMSRVVDTANQYFLHVAPAGYRIGVGYKDQLVFPPEVSNPTGALQRPFDPDCPIGAIAGPDPRPGNVVEGVYPLPLIPVTKDQKNEEAQA